MGFKKVVKKGVFSGFNAKRWVGFDQIKDSGKTIGSIYSDLFETKKKPAPRRETFEECIKRYGLSEADIKRRMKTALRTSWGCLLFGLPLLAYSLYLLFTGSFLSGFASLMLSFLVWAYAFRENFNYFQMKQRRLGCTFKEWVEGTFKGSK